MKEEFEIYFWDLTPKAQKEYLEFMEVKSAKELNEDIIPITSIPKPEPEEKTKTQ